MSYSYSTIIVGAGLTGLSTAALFEKNHKDYFLIEKDTEIGGKIKSSDIEGWSIDCGFHVFIKEYPNLSLFPDLKRCELINFEPGFIIIKNQKAYKNINIFKKFFNGLIHNNFPGFSLKDKFLILKLSLVPPNYLPKSNSVLEFLQEYGFSKEFINDFFINFFQGVFLDKKLDVPLSYFLFIFKMFSISDVGIPKGGIKEIISIISKRIPESKIKTGVSINKIYKNKIVTDEGNEYYFKKLICTDSLLEKKFDATIKKNLFGEICYSSTKCFYFIVEPENNPENIIHLLPQSELISSLYFRKRNSKEMLMSVSTLNCEATVEDVEKQILEHFPKINIIKFQKSFEIQKALPKNKKFFNYNNENFCKYNENIFFAGDFLSNPSINGCLESSKSVVRFLS